MAKKDDAYAICTAQKKKSGMGHDAWKRCVAKLKKEESVMNFKNRVLSILEKRGKMKEQDDPSTSDARLAREKAEKTRAEREAEGEEFDEHGRRIYSKHPDGDTTDKDESKKSRMKKKALKTEKMKNVLPSGPKAAPQATKSNNDAEEELDDEDTIFDDCGTKLVAKYRAKKKKGVKEADAYGVDKDYEKIPQHMKDAAKKKARDETNAARKKAGLDPLPDDFDPDKKTEANLAEWKPKTYHTIPGEDETDFKDPKDMTPAEKAALEAEYEKGRKEKDAEHAAWMADIEKRKKEKEASVNASKKSKVKEGSRPFKPNKPGIGAMSDADRAEKARVPSDDEVKRELQRRKDAGKCADGSDPPCKEDKSESKTEAKKDDKWIQKAVDPDHEGYCTPMTKATCTPKRKALAKTFKKMGKKRDKATKAKDEK